MSALSDALNEANTNKWSSRDIARRSEDRINHATVAKYLNGNHGSPTESVLVVFSEVFGLPLTRLRELAGLPAGERTAYQPPPEASRLDRRQRKAVDELIRLLAEATPEVGDGDGRDAAPTRLDPAWTDPVVSEVPSSVPLKRVARRDGSKKK